LEIVLDSEGNFVSLRELPVEEVAPQSWLDRILKRKPKVPPFQISTVDFIGLIDWINTIKTIDTIKTINLINELNAVGTINRISEIGKIASGIVVPELITNPRFETGDLSGWLVYAGSPSVDSNIKWYDLPSLKLPANSEVWHILNQGCYGDEVYLYGAVRSSASDGYVFVRLVFSDFTKESFLWQVSGANTWYYFRSQGSTAKPVVRIEIANYYEGTTTWVSGFVVLKAIQTVKQMDRTNLKVQIEREDLITKSWDLTSGTTTLLSAVSGKRHKIYGWDYEVDADGTTEFIATIGGATVKFGRRKTKGVHALTLIHPIICDVNTALTFQSAGNTSLSLRYITE
jgi:hypothetical protein